MHLATTGVEKLRSIEGVRFILLYPMEEYLEEKSVQISLSVASAVELHLHCLVLAWKQNWLFLYLTSHPSWFLRVAESSAIVSAIPSACVATAQHQPGIAPLLGVFALLVRIELAQMY
jgi:hypothetical protein